MKDQPHVVSPDAAILVTGAAGFIGLRVVQNLMARGFRNVKCFVRPSSDVTQLEALATRHPDCKVEIIKGNLLVKSDCVAATKGVTVIFHVAAGTGEKSFPDAFMNSVVTTRNLLEAVRGEEGFRRFVNVSSFAVYANVQNKTWRLLDESCAVEQDVTRIPDAYCFAKVRQDMLVKEYGHKYDIPYVVASAKM